MYRYETHLHTAPVSACGQASPRENLEYYKALGYDGIFITNHFLDGNIRYPADAPYEERLAFYFSDYEEAKRLSQEIGIKVFCGVELSYKGTDFLVYGLDHSWFAAHPQIMEMKKTEELAYMMEAGALVIQAHPFREAWYIDHIRLFPRCVHGIEVINACRTELENRMAQIYAREYGLLPFAGTDNHLGNRQKSLAGMRSAEPVTDEKDFVRKVLAGQMEVFTQTAE